jgi:hypothetical protein
MGGNGMRRAFVSTAMIGLAVLAPLWVAPGGTSVSNVIGHPCSLVSATQAGELLGGPARQLGVGGSDRTTAKPKDAVPGFADNTDGASCLYVLQNAGDVLPGGTSPSIQVVTSTKERSVRTVKTLLNPRKLKVIQHVPKGVASINFTRHFVGINGKRTVYTVQGDPAVVVSTSGELLPQANISTIVGRATVQILVTGVTQPQQVAKITMGDALSHF